MFFEQIVKVKDLRLSDKLEGFQLSGPWEIDVWFRPPTEEEIEAGHDRSDAFGHARAELNPSEANTDILEQIAGDDVGQYFEIERDRQRYENGENYAPSLSGFPAYFQSFARGCKRELLKAIHGVLGAIRWRYNLAGPPNPISVRKLHWSRDGNKWFSIPRDTKVSISFSRFLGAEDIERDKVLELARCEKGEPTHHELFREAWSQIRKNPRSAIVIGMSAAEVSVKNCISELIPEAQWLVDEIPTPPLRKLLAEFIPQLPAKNTINGEVKAPPKSLRDEIGWKGTDMRNRVVHTGAEAPDQERIEQLLWAVRDLLWLMDYYTGHGWAFEYISQSTLEELGVEKQGATDIFADQQRAG